MGDEFAQVGEFLFDFTSTLGVFRDDALEVAAKDAFTGGEEVEGIGGGV
ncbi:MAG: hypothetical protein RI897_2195 [Verrucomicrobiota bacterium]